MTKKLVPISEAGLPEAIVGSVLNYLVAHNLSDDFAVDKETKKVHVNPEIIGKGGDAQPGHKVTRVIKVTLVHKVLKVTLALKVLKD